MSPISDLAWGHYKRQGALHNIEAPASIPKQPERPPLYTPNKRIFDLFAAYRELFGGHPSQGS